jgi:hypothetical protein
MYHESAPSEINEKDVNGCLYVKTPYIRGFMTVDYECITLNPAQTRSTLSLILHSDAAQSKQTEAMAGIPP